MEITLKNAGYRSIIGNINISIEFDKITTIIGPTGSGKTTLLQLLCMLKPLTSGKLIIDNRYKIGFVNQNVEEQFFFRTVEKELESTLETSNYSSEKRKKRVLDSIKMVNLSNDLLAQDPLNLSSSEMRKLAIAKALIVNPDILVLDEPVIGMDDKDKQSLIKVLRMLKRRYNRTIIISTRDMEFVHLISDNIIVLNKGKVVTSGDKYSVFKQVAVLKKNNIDVPKIIEFENRVLDNKKIKLGYRDDINDLIKDILRNKKI